MQATQLAKNRTGLSADRCCICDRKATQSRPLKPAGEANRSVCPYCDRVWHTLIQELRHVQGNHPQGVSTTQVLYVCRKFIILAEQLGVSARNAALLLEAAGAFN